IAFSWPMTVIRHSTSPFGNCSNRSYSRSIEPPYLLGRRQTNSAIGLFRKRTSSTAIWRRRDEIACESTADCSEMETIGGLEPVLAADRRASGTRAQYL